MPAKILKARAEGSQFVIQIHLDDTWMLYPLKEAVDEQGNAVRVRAGDPYPDPAWVVEYAWGLDQAPETSLRESTLLAAGELARRQPPESKALPFEGQSLDLAAAQAERGAADFKVADPPAESRGDAGAAT